MRQPIAIVPQTTRQTDCVRAVLGEGDLSSEPRIASAGRRTLVKVVTAWLTGLVPPRSGRSLWGNMISNVRRILKRANVHRLDTCAHRLSVVDRDEERSNAVVLPFNDEFGPYDAYGRQTRRNRRWHKPVQIS